MKTQPHILWNCQVCDAATPGCYRAPTSELLSQCQDKGVKRVTHGRFIRDRLHSRFTVAWMLIQVHCIDSFVYRGHVRAKVRSGSGFSTLGILGRAGSPVLFVEELSDERFGEIRSKGTVEPMADSRNLCFDCFLRYMHQRRVIHSSSTQSGP